MYELTVAAKVMAIIASIACAWFVHRELDRYPSTENIFVDFIFAAILGFTVVFVILDIPQ